MSVLNVIRHEYTLKKILLVSFHGAEAHVLSEHFCHNYSLFLAEADVMTKYISEQCFLIE